MSRHVFRSLQFLIASVVLLPLAGRAESGHLSVPFITEEISADRSELKAVVTSEFYSEAAAVSERLQLTLPLPDDDDITLDLKRFDNIAPDARFLIGSPLGDDPMPRPNVATFRGEVEGQSGSFAYLAVSPSGMTNGFVDRGTGYTYSLGTLREDLRAGDLLLTVKRASAFEEGDVPFCGVDDNIGLTIEPVDGEVRAPALAAGPYMQRIAIDADQAFVQLFASTMDARDYIVQLMGAVSSIYERDNNVRMTLAYARLWPSGGEPFNVNDLNGFRMYWWANEDTTGLNIVHMFSGTRPDNYGGIAYYSTTCDGAAYGICGSFEGNFPAPIETPHRDNWDLNVVTHEMGHNHGAHHTHDPYFDPTIDECGNGVPSRGTIMSYCHATSAQGGELNVDMRFHRRIQEQISQNVWPAGCHSRDCNGNSVSDAVDIAQAVSADVNSDGIPDECQDCNDNGTLDPAEIAGGATDYDGNGVPDECETDCNTNGIPDQYETWVGLADDDDGNNVPDECDPDCNSNGVLDYTDINTDMSLDVDRNRILDECQDCLDNGSPDWVDAGRSQFLYICDPYASEFKEYHPVTGVMDRLMPAGSGALNDVIASTDGAYLYLADGSLGVLRVDPVSAAATLFIANGTGGLTLAGAVCFGPGGDLLVADYAGNAVRRYDGASGAYIADFVASGASPLASPISMVYGPNGNLFVGGAVAVYEYSGATGLYIGQFVGAGSGGLDRAAGLAFKGDGNLLVSSKNSNELLEFDGTTGAFIGVFNDPTVTISAPWGIEVTSAGHVLLACKNLNDDGRVYAYDEDTGAWLFSHIWGTLTGPSGFCHLPATAADANGNMIPDACEGGDADSDGVSDYADNCPYESNTLQTDSDGDGSGDACDNCPTVTNADQRNGDGDDYGDECDNCPGVTNIAQTDSDSDGRGDGCDNCQGLMNSDQTDSDGDFVGDACDPCPNDFTDDADGDGFCGDVDNCPHIFNPDQADDNSNGYGDICEPEFVDVVASNCLKLAVSSRGNVGNQGLAGSTMDYVDQGDCLSASVYLYNGSPIIAYEEMGEYYAYHTMHGRNSFHQLAGGSLAEPTVTTTDYQVYRTGQFETPDSGIGLEMAWYAPSHPDTCSFVIQKLSVFPTDGQAHSGLAVGQGVDWDIPSASGSDNYGGHDASSGLVYQYGVGADCEDNTTRFGGQAVLGVTYSGNTCVDPSAQAHGGYTALNSDYVFPTGTFVPQEMYDNMQTPGFASEPTAADQHAVTTYFNDLSLGAADTVSVYLIFATVRTGSVTDLVNIVEQAEAWFFGHIGDECSSTCCDPPTVGDVDQSGVVDITDVSVLVDNQFLTLTVLDCEDEGDVDFSGTVDITDLSIVIDNQFLTLTALPPCP